MEDFEDMVLEIRQGVERRGLRLMEAVFPGQPAVVLQYETTSVDEILDLAQHAFAPFLSLTVSRLDPSELIETWHPDDDAKPEPPPQLLNQWQERSGQIDGVFLQWIASGAVFLYHAVPSWKQELEEIQESWSEEQDAQSTNLYRASRIRITHLAEQLERDPQYRGGTTHTRVSIGKTFLEPLLQSNEGGYITTLILREASRLVRDNAQAEYSKLMGRIDELARELRASLPWQEIHTVRDRTAVARKFLTEQSNGYAPSTAMTNELRRLAEQSR
ncbi:hypothetical protein GCM10027404_09640 [Arthrobacter tumbae]|uniref:hypothetical protein n=1 Tax=Arthrobacter tumbae TaxID=163874 RepID=UPI00195CF8B2|nr:hypothetical protein [Arthrobacter tumbae]MBM7782246.1 hypothetical protein [Arthrobacter tumbae]